MALTIKTNGQARYLKYGYELPAKWRKEFDYMDDETFNDGAFLTYRGCVYNLGDFIRTAEDSTGDLAAWDGYISETFFSGVVIKLRDDKLIMGSYFCSFE